MRNIIGKQNINFQFNGNADAFVLQQKVASWCKDILNPAIDAALADYEGRNDILSIDRMVISLNIDKPDLWQEGLAEQIIRQMRERLQGTTGAENEIITKTGHRNFFETLMYFLKHGILPWHTYIKTKDEFQNSFSAWLQEAERVELDELLLMFQDNKIVARFVDQVSQNNLQLFLAKIFVVSQEFIGSVLDDVRNIIHWIFADDRLELKRIRLFAQMLLSAAPASSSREEMVRAATQWLRKLKEDHPDETKKIELAEIQVKELKHIARQMLKEVKAGKVTTKEQTLPKVISKDEAPGSVEEERAPVKDMQEGIFINNAGAVIIAPFLPTLFLRTGLQNDNDITNPNLAICLLHYCITGNVSPAEFELVLPKILCGIEPDQPIETPARLEETLLHEADEMLLSVIEYWSILKDTSIDGLRESFLQRDGKLSFFNNEWLLQVDQRPFDMLLQQLPWSIRILKLSWMRDQLRTEWI